MPLPQKIVEGLTTKADKIRALDRAGFERVEIARFLGISYQHVRNTLVRVPLSSARSTQPGPPPAHNIQHEAWPAKKLLGSGFELLGECVLGDVGFTYTAKAPTGAGVYAFAVEGKIVYIGLTRFGLRTRLSHYVYGHEGQKTSARVKALILNELANGKRVEVLVAQPPELEWNGLPIDGPSGLETGLIRLLRPIWNQHGNC